MDTGFFCKQRALGYILVAVSLRDWLQWGCLPVHKMGKDGIIGTAKDVTSTVHSEKIEKILREERLSDPGLDWFQRAVTE